MTAVQLLKHRISQLKLENPELEKLLDEAETHEKSQLKIAYASGYVEGFNQLDCDEHIITSEQYYNKNYKYGK
jgi:hypothetical protein